MQTSAGQGRRNIKPCHSHSDSHHNSCRCILATLTSLSSATFLLSMRDTCACCCKNDVPRSIVPFHCTGTRLACMHAQKRGRLGVPIDRGNTARTLNRPSYRCRPIILQAGSTIPIWPLSQGRPTWSWMSPFARVTSSPVHHRRTSHPWHPQDPMMQTAPPRGAVAAPPTPSEAIYLISFG